jgi:hypothetical protein
VSEILKLFNVVFVALTIGFSFLFASAYLRSVHKGFFAALVLAALPSFMSHFIWSQSLALCLFPVAMYATLRALDDARWTGPAILSVASLMVTQPVVSLMAGVVLILLAAALYLHERDFGAGDGALRWQGTRRAFVVGAGGLAASLLFWGAQLAKWGVSGIFGAKGDEFTSKWTDVYAGRGYTLQQLVFPQADTIDQPSGWGLVVTLALAAGAIAYSARVVGSRGSPRPAFTDLHLLAWFGLLFYVVFAPVVELPTWGSWRAWAYLAVPVALLATEGVFEVGRLSLKLDPRLELPLVVAGALGILATSAPAKIELETSAWPPGQHWYYAHTDQGALPVGLAGYVKMRDMLPRSTRVFALCGNGDGHTIGFDMESTPWDPEEAAFRAREGASLSVAETLQFLGRHRYAHFTFDAACAQSWGQAVAERFLAGLDQDPRVKALYRENGFVLAEVRSP